MAQFRDQTQRFLAGQLPDDEYRALRLRNGFELQDFSAPRLLKPRARLTAALALTPSIHVGATFSFGESE